MDTGYSSIPANTNMQSQLRKCECECWYFFSASSWITIFYPFNFIPFHLFPIYFEELCSNSNSNSSSSSKNIRFIPHQQIKCNAIMAYNEQEHSYGLLMPKYTKWITIYMHIWMYDIRVLNVSKCMYKSVCVGVCGVCLCWKWIE